MSEMISRRHLYSKRSAYKAWEWVRLADQTSMQTTGYHLTWAVEKVRSFKNISFMDVRLNSVITIQILLTLIHLTALYHFQPLRVMPAELFTLNFLSPFFIIFLSKTNSQLSLRKPMKELLWLSDNSTFILWEFGGPFHLGQRKHLKYLFRIILYNNQ